MSTRETYLLLRRLLLKQGRRGCLLLLQLHLLLLRLLLLHLLLLLLLRLGL